MANHETRPGSWGKIPPAKKVPDGLWRATGRYKTKAGKLIQRFRTGTTARKAEDALLELFQEMAAEDKAKMEVTERSLAAGRSGGADVLFADVVGERITYNEAGGKGLRVSTAYEYARMPRADILPFLGELRLVYIDFKGLRRFPAWHRRRRPILCESRT